MKDTRDRQRIQMIQISGKGFDSLVNHRVVQHLYDDQLTQLEQQLRHLIAKYEERLFGHECCILSR